MRRPDPRPVVLVLTLLVVGLLGALGLAGCDLPGHKGHPSATPAAFAAAAQARCGSAAAQAREAGAVGADGQATAGGPDPSGYREGLRALRAAELDVRDVLARPADLTSAIRAFADLEVSVLDRLSDASRAVERGDTVEEQGARKKVADLRPKAAAAAKALGIGGCAF